MICCRRALQVTVLVPGFGARVVNVSPVMSVDDLLASVTGIRRGTRAASCVCHVFLGARMLCGCAVLADVGIVNGIRLEVRPMSVGGMRPGSEAPAGIGDSDLATSIEFRSISRAGMKAVLVEARDLLRSIGYEGRMTSHTLQGLFKNGLKKANGELRRGPGQFHPAKRWPNHYSKDVPSIVVTYTWTIDLENELDKFMDEAERVLKLDPAEKEAATWWLDIFFNDQNKLEDMDVVLEKAERCYLMAENHVVFLMNGVFKRGWCCAEIAYRIQVLGGLGMYGQPFHIRKT